MHSEGQAYSTNLHGSESCYHRNKLNLVFVSCNRHNTHTCTARAELIKMILGADWQIVKQISFFHKSFPKIVDSRFILVDVQMLCKLVFDTDVRPYSFAALKLSE